MVFGVFVRMYYMCGLEEEVLGNANHVYSRQHKSYSLSHLRSPSIFGLSWSASSLLVPSHVCVALSPCKTSTFLAYVVFLQVNFHCCCSFRISGDNDDLADGCSQFPPLSVLLDGAAIFGSASNTSSPSPSPAITVGDTLPISMSRYSSRASIT